MITRVFCPPGKCDLTFDRLSLFLAGSIETGKAEDWQTHVINELKDFSVDIMNPRRKDWDSSWKQEKNNPQFREQVLWELNGLQAASIIPLYYSPETQSPITLMENGLFASSKKLIICCPHGFYRKGNVDIVAEKFDIPLYENFDSFVKAIKNKIDSLKYLTYGYN